MSNNISDKPRDSLLIKTIYQCLNDNVELYWRYIDKFINQSNKLGLLNNIVEIFSNQNNNKYFSDEIIYFLNVMNMSHLPLEWIEKFKTYKILLKGSKEQGRNNGPDFIFENENKKIGLEFISPIKNVFFNPDNEFRDRNKGTFSAIKNQEYFWCKNFNDFINLLFETINDKILKSRKYEKTDELYLQIFICEYKDITMSLIDESLKGLWKIFAEFIVNKIEKYKKTFAKIFIN